MKKTKSKKTKNEADAFNKNFKKTETEMIKRFQKRIDEIENVMKGTVHLQKRGNDQTQNIYDILIYVDKIKNELDGVVGAFVPHYAAAGMYKKLFELFQLGVGALPVLVFRK